MWLIPKIVGKKEKEGLFSGFKVCQIIFYKM